MNTTKSWLPIWTNKKHKQNSKHHRIITCQCCGKRFEIVASLAKGRKFFNPEHARRWYEIGGRKGKVWSKVKVKGGKNE